MNPPAYPDSTFVTPFTLAYTASTHQKQPPARVATSNESFISTFIISPLGFSLFDCAQEARAIMNKGKINFNFIGI